MIVPRIVAGCLIFAQFLSPFPRCGNDPVTMLELLGIFVEKLVRHCINFRAKSGYSVTNPYMSWLARSEPQKQ